MRYMLTINHYEKLTWWSVKKRDIKLNAIARSMICFAYLWFYFFCCYLFEIRQLRNSVIIVAVVVKLVRSSGDSTHIITTIAVIAPTAATAIIASYFPEHLSFHSSCFKSITFSKLISLNLAPFCRYFVQVRYLILSSLS